MQGIYRFFNTAIPVRRCNLRCSYCYVSQKGKNTEKHDESLDYSLKHMRRSLTVERLGGPCMFNLCADGETLLFSELTETIQMLLELDHYVSIVTNLTITHVLEKIIRLPKHLLERFFIKISLHYLELRNKGLLDKFFDNIALIRDKNIAYSVEICASDDYIPYIEEIKELCMLHIGALPHVVELRDERDLKYPRLTNIEVEDYQAIWSSFYSPLFEYETKKYEKYQDKFCHAGDYGFTLCLKTGEVTPCNCNGIKKIFNIFKNSEEPLKFASIGSNCPSAHCFLNYVWCALVGNYSDIDVPTYAEERDRVTSDGKHWLTPLFGEIYSHRCSEFHKPYSENKAFYVDLLMRKHYGGIDPSENELDKLVTIVGETLSNQGIKTIAVYGMGVLGRWLVNILKRINVQVVYGIDRRWAEIESHILVQSPDSPIPVVDGVIVSVFAEFSSIAPFLREKTQAQILSLVELAG